MPEGEFLLSPWHWEQQEVTDSPGRGTGFLGLKSESATGSFVDVVLQRAAEMVESDRGPQTKHSRGMRINARF